MRYFISFLILLLLLLAGGYYYLVYFNSLPETVVPDVRGMPLKSALEKLEKLELEGREVGRVFEVKYPAGWVVSQRPEPGRKVKVGRTVNLMVSSGREKVIVPNLIGRNLSQVDAVLSATELKLGEVKRETQPHLEEGIVIAQEPLPNEEVLVGSQVNLIVSTTLEVKEEVGEQNE